MAGGVLIRGGAGADPSIGPPGAGDPRYATAFSARDGQPTVQIKKPQISSLYIRLIYNPYTLSDRRKIFMEYPLKLLYIGPKLAASFQCVESIEFTKGDVPTHTQSHPSLTGGGRRLRGTVARRQWPAGLAPSIACRYCPE